MPTLWSLVLLLLLPYLISSYFLVINLVVVNMSTFTGLRDCLVYVLSYLHIYAQFWLISRSLFPSNWDRLCGMSQCQIKKLHNEWSEYLQPIVNIFSTPYKLVPYCREWHVGCFFLLKIGVPIHALNNMHAPIHIALSECLQIFLDLFNEYT